MRLNDLISVAPRYARAINLERDGFTANGVEGYVVTSTADDFLLRFSRSRHEISGHRAWTLTGPYGAGKSSFALFLANLFSPAIESGAISARRILKEQHQETYKEIFERGGREKLGKDGLAAVVVSGSAEPLLGALVRSVIRDAGLYFTHGRKPDVLKELDTLEAKIVAGKEVSTSSVMNAVVRLCTNLVSSGRTRGIVIVIDELGKFLEFAARTQNSGDLFVLQQLAEATSDSSNPGLFLVTILHQSFERYASELRPMVREEWAKVQGRFEDVAFQEPPEQLLELISRAVCVRQPNHPALKALSSASQELAKKAISLDLSPRGMTSKAFASALERCAPLHPLTALVLIRLCRKFGQNQRSLFSFLTSRERYGFTSFLQQSPQNSPGYGLAELYDYLAEGLGSGLAVGESASRWAEIQNALERAASASAIEIRFIKTVGVLAAVGQIGNLKASPEVLRFALGLEVSDFRRYRRLLAEKSLIIERKHSGTVALWEGSDLDLDEEVKSAGKHVSNSASLAEKLNGLWAPRPLVAKRHSFRTGTLRYFSVRFADVGNLSKSLVLDSGADGLLLYCLPTSRADFDVLRDLAENAALREKREILIAIPSEVASLRDSVHDLEVLRHVQTHTRELQADAVARRELRARVSAAENRVSVEVQRLFSPEERTAKETAWYHHGIRQNIPTTRTLADYLSSICDRVYEHTPILRNELVNRRGLSSAAAAARRNLIDAMISKSSVSRLGFEGTPPEVSIYSSILSAPGIHRADGVGYAFGAPHHDPALVEVWSCITAFFADCELKRHTVADLFVTLQSRPFGLKSGVIPILFCAAAMAHDTEIAFYEGGAFLPELTVDAFERLIRSPERFELRKYRIEGLRKEVYAELAHLFGQPTPARGESLMSVMKPLYRFLHRLPMYCRETRHLSPRTIAVRTALLYAKEPDQLLFHELPIACGLEAFSPDEAGGERTTVFFTALRTSITELQRAYEDLLGDLQDLLFRAFDIKERASLEVRAKSVRSYCVESKLKAVVNIFGNEHMEDSLWIEAVATTLTGKAPKSWNDDDRVRYEIALAETSRNVRHLEALLYEERKRLDAGRKVEEIFRLGVSDRHSMEIGAVLVVEQADRNVYMSAVVELQSHLEHLDISPQLALAALASVSKGLLSEYMASAPMVLEDQKVKHGR
ncbi:MAG: hypothetical protein M3Y50_15985 [Acidobacteriota bacterium]|nr:hypothetical protein [Acidobacteriota bacterium]